MWNCKCVLNSDEGCLLSPKVRPLGGLLLIPTDKRCNQVYTDAKQFRRWSPYQNRLKYLSRLYSERTVLIPDTVDKEQVKKLEFALRGEKYS